MLVKHIEKRNKRIRDLYGKKGGWLWHNLYLCLYQLGGLQVFTDIDWRRVSRLVFVCKGNICRSPYAEVLASELGVEVASFGLEADGKSPADPSALRNAMQRGVDLGPHRSKIMGAIKFSSGDLLIGMEPWHGKQLRQFPKKYGAQVTLLGLWSKEPRPYLQDPLGLSDSYFQTCFACVDAAVNEIVNRISVAR